MDGFSLTIIGAGSSYTPELIEGLARMRAELPVSKIILMDINEQRLEIMSGFCRRFLEHLGQPIPIETTTDRKQAIAEAKFIITQIRVGGNAQRILDEKIPLKYGIIGQETTGPGGMFKALRTIPIMLEIARDVVKLNPSAWVINYTNPTGLVTEAVQKYTRANFVGLCSGVLFPGLAAKRALGVDPKRVHFRYFGLNHLNFAYDLTIDGRPVSEEEFDSIAEKATWGLVDPTLVKTMRLLPSPYLQYFFHRSKRVTEAKAKEHTRGEVVQMLEAEVFKAYADPNQTTKPEALSKRGGGGYSEIALDVMDALYNDRGKQIIVNTAQRGAVQGLPEDAVLEIASLVNAAGIFPIHLPDIPKAVWGLVAAVKNYEQLTVEAAVSGDRKLALEALLAHPLAGDYDVCVRLLDEMLAANRDFLPQFC